MEQTVLDYIFAIQLTTMHEKSWRSCFWPWIEDVSFITRSRGENASDAEGLLKV